MLFSIEIENSRPSSNSNWLSSRTCMINILCQNCWEVINSGDSFLKDSCKALHTFPSKLKLPIASLSLDAEYLLQWLNLAYFLFFRTFFLPYFCNQSILHCNSFFSGFEKGSQMKLRLNTIWTLFLNQPNTVAILLAKYFQISFKAHCVLPLLSLTLLLYFHYQWMQPFLNRVSSVWATGHGSKCNPLISFTSNCETSKTQWF